MRLSWQILKKEIRNSHIYQLGLERGGLMPSSDEANEETTVIGFGSSPSRRGLKPITRKEYEKIAVEYFNRVPISRPKFGFQREGNSR